MTSTQALGKSQARLDGPAKVTGRALYPGDISYPQMLHMATLFAGRPHARILSIDSSTAESAPGVVAVLTAKDVPVNAYGLQMPDQPVLCGPGSGRPGADVVRFVGDQIALIIAETEDLARAALPLIRVEWQDLPLELDAEAAMRPDAYQLHHDKPGNITYSYHVRTGDPETALAEADVVVEAVYRTPVQEHAYLQPESGVAWVDENGVVCVKVAGQWAHEDQKEIALALGIPRDQVRVVYPAIGGAFGGREDMSVQITLGLAAWRLAQRGIRQPVKTVWNREESIIGHGKRHAMTLYAKWGAKRDGALVAAQMRVIADGGAYCYTSNKVLGNTTLTCTGPYYIPNASVDTYAIYTNNLPGAAFRGFGGPQGQFAAEGQMDRLAEALGMDPVELRLKNVLADPKPMVTGYPMPGGQGLTETIRQAALRAGWTEDDAGHWRSPLLANDDCDVTRRGVGFAVGFKNVGFSFGYQENSHARIELHGQSEIDEAVLYIAGADVGQGHHTAMVQIAAEVLGIAPTGVRVVASDTATSHDSGSASASRLTYMAGNAVKGAAEQALAAWKSEERPAIGDYKYLAPKTTKLDPVTGQGEPNFAYGYAAQAAQVAVDTQTGHVRIERFVCADDVGQAVNPQSVVGQIEGAVVQALGYSLLEDFRTEGGQVLTDRLSTYLIPTVLDIPGAVESVVVEVPDPNGPFGARGMGEMPYLPTAPAVIAAVHRAIGIRFDDFPLTAERVWRGLRDRSATQGRE